MPSTGKTNDREISYHLQDLEKKFLSQQLAVGRSPRTLHVYRRILRDLRCSLNIEDVRNITKETMQSYADQVLQYSFGADEKRQWLARIKIFFRWVAEDSLILADPTAVITLPATKRKKYPIYLRQQEITQLLDSVSVNRAEGLRDRAILELLYSSGLRSSEICKLTLADINFADGTVRVLMSKCKKDRIVPVGKTALHWIDRYIKEVHGLQMSGSLFYHLNDGRSIQDWYLRRIVSKYRKKAQLKKHCHPRNFRHSFAIHLLENGASIRHIQAMMGHADLRTTQKYTRIVPAELKRVHARAHPGEYRRGVFPQVEPVRFRSVNGRSRM
jgi:integrase/recombinase XerD